MATDHNSPFLKTTFFISMVLIAAGLVMAFMVVVLRFKNMAVISEDVLLATVAIVMIGSGAALTSFANGLRLKLMLETAKAAEQVSSDGLQSLRNRLLDAIRDRIASISVQPVASLSSSAPSLTLNPTFTDSLGLELQPEKERLGLTWKSDNLTAATVDSRGVVTFVGAGTANITVEFRNRSSNKCVVTCT